MEMTNVNISITPLSHYSNTAPQIKHTSSGQKHTCSKSNVYWTVHHCNS